MNVILCGFNWTGCKALKFLLENNHNVFVFTHENEYHIPSLINLCRKYNVPFSTENISKKKLPFKPDIIASIYYRYIIKENIINACESKIFNLHPSLLPKYRGCSSITWSLINGESEYGFTYHYIDEGCDTGDIILQKKMKIEEWDTQLSLYNRVMFESMKYFEEVFHKVTLGDKGIKQNGEASIYARGCPYNGIISDDMNLEVVERFIRAMYFPPYKSAMYKGQEVKTLEEFLNLKNP